MQQSMPILRRGSVGDDVKRLQMALCVKADGIFGPDTEHALEQFQIRHHLNPDKVAGNDTWNKIRDVAPFVLKAPLMHMPPLKHTAAAEPTPPKKSMANDSFEAPPPLAARARQLVVVDIGHGWIKNDIPNDGIKDGLVYYDSGAKGIDRQGQKFDEADLALAIGRQLRSQLRGDFDVVLTRDDKSIVAGKYDPRIALGHDQKIMHLSIHCDSAPQSHQGMKVFYSDKLGLHSASAQFASTLSHGQPNPHNTDLLDAKKMGNAAAVLVEVGNMRSPDDVTRMASAQGQAAIAKTLADRIRSYYSGTYHDALPPLQLAKAMPKGKSPNLPA